MYHSLPFLAYSLFKSQNFWWARSWPLLLLFGQEGGFLLLAGSCFAGECCLLNWGLVRCRFWFCTYSFSLNTFCMWFTFVITTLLTFNSVWVCFCYPFYLPLPSFSLWEEGEGGKPAFYLELEAQTRTGCIAFLL